MSTDTQDRAQRYRRQTAPPTDFSHASRRPRWTGAGMLGLALLTRAAFASAEAPPPGAPARPVDLPPPVTPACVSSPFGPRRLVGPRAATFHNGIDFPAPAGAWVHAVADGTVAGIQRRGAEGLEVDLLHPGGFATRYAHLGTVSPALASGARHVTKGEAIGRIGRTGVTYGTHLHFELRVGGTLVDPEPSFGVRRCG